MKSKLNSTRLLSGKPLVLALVIFMISCTKSSITPANSSIKYCKTISWTETSGSYGSFTGALINGQYELTSLTYSELGKNPGTINFTYDASGHLMNQAGLTVTYNQDVLVNYIVDLSYVSSATGTDTFTFNTSGQLTNESAVGTNDSGPITFSSDFTYDSNGDPVHITGHATQITNNQLETDTYDITVNYWEDKATLIAYVPIAAPFSTYFNVFGSLLSKHLINQMSVTLTSSIGSQSEVATFSPIYLYTYDANGRVATMKKTVQSPLSSNVFTFTYTGCN